MEEQSDTKGTDRPQRAGWEEKDHANVDFVKSLLFGVGGFIDNIYKITLTLRDSLIVNRTGMSLLKGEERTGLCCGKPN